MSGAADAATLRRNVFFNTAGNLIYFGCQWLATGFLIKALSFGDAGLTNTGLLQTAMAVTNVFLTLASYGMRTYQVSDVNEKYSSSIYITSRLVTVGASVLLCAAYTMAVGYSREQAACIFIYLVYKLLEALTDVFHGCCQKSERMDIIGISYAVRGCLSVAVFAFVLWLSQNVALTLAAMTAVCCVFCLFYDIIGTRNFFAPFRIADAKSVGQLLLECMPLALYVFFVTSAASVPKIMLERIMGTEIAGIYGLVNSPVMILQVGVAFMFTPFITMFAKKYRDCDRKGFLRLAALVTLGVLALGVLALGGVAILGEWGLGFLYGAEITAYRSLLTPMVLCSVLTSLVLFYCMLLTVERCMKGLIFGNLLGLVISALLSAPMINSHSLFGASYATLASLVCQCAALMLFGLQALRKPPKG
ncbi:MAG: oligosaccharide flippase family protein [Oscillospiraceae bacterium]